MAGRGRPVSSRRRPVEPRLSGMVLRRGRAGLQRSTRRGHVRCGSSRAAAGAPDRRAEGHRDPADVRLRPRGGVQPDRARRRARPCSTSSPARARSGSRRSRAARERASSSTPTATPAGRSSANLEQASACAATVLCQDAVRALAAERGTYDLVLCDPPYELRRVRAARAAPARVSSRPTACSSTDRRAARARARRASASAPPASTARRALRCSSGDHRDLPRLLRPRHERPRRRDHARGRDLRPRRRRRRRHAAAQDAAVPARGARRARPRGARAARRTSRSTSSRSSSSTSPAAGTRG